MIKYKNIEILAPAGNFDSLIAGINAGCNAIFFGVGDINMRATNTANFKLEELDEISRICKKHKIRSYLTLNTIMYNNDLSRIEDILTKAKKSEINAVIASDISTISYARKIGIEVHISTQLSISNTEAVKFYSQFADRIVLARELTIEEVKKIVDDIKKFNIRGPKGNLVEIEIFIHGALCVAVSGRCSMSLYCYGSSANRGKCTQVCRHKYKVVDLDTNQELVIDNNYVMSSSDLCTIGMLDKILDSGATVLKIEGRGRGPEYVETVVTCYKEALDAINRNTYTEEKILEWNKRLGTVFNRGFTKGLYMGRNFDEWSGVHGNKATKEKIFIGKVVKYYPKAKVVEIILNLGELRINDEILITGNEVGIQEVKLSEFWVNEKKVDTVNKNDSFTIKNNNSRIKKGDSVYIWKEKSSMKA